VDKLNQKFALVTGGSRGIGKAICLDLVKQGFNVAFTYFRNSNIAKKTLTELKKEKKECFSIKTHLGKEKDIEILFEKINNKFGKLDVLVNNAATGINVKSEELSPKHWDWVMNTNAKGPWISSIFASKLMKNGGSIINISSPGSQKVLSNYFSVGVSKSALESVTRYLSIELADKNIRVNTISPGIIKTDALNAFPSDSEINILANRTPPSGKSLETTDVAKLVTFLCSEDSYMIRGQNIIIDGGETLLPRI
tara:strand:+ start:526 stop:1284 length:759 start_codon:yes stop_codon:yes gene_type:complete